MAEDRVVLVGVDGSPESLGAVDWAVARAARENWRVHILCAYSLPSFTTASLDGGYAALDASAIRSGAQAVVDEAVTAAEVEDLVRRAAGDLAEEVRLFDVFRGAQLGEGKKSLAVSLVLRAPDRTLTAEETAGVRKRVIKRAAKLLGAELRS